MNPPTDTRATRGRGRPTVIDPVRIAEAAIALWHEHGYAQTGWREIAEATGVSTRTLMRHFGSRAELPWIGVGPAVERLNRFLAAAGDHEPTGDVVRRAVTASIARSEQMRRIAPDWLAVVAAEPELAATAPRAYAPWTERIAAFIAERNPGMPPAVAHALAVAYQVAAFEALVSWSLEGAEGDPADAVDQMLRWLDIHAPLDVADELLAPNQQPEQLSIPEKLEES